MTTTKFSAHPLKNIDPTVYRQMHVVSLPTAFLVKETTFLHNDFKYDVESFLSECLNGFLKNSNLWAVVVEADTFGDNSSKGYVYENDEVIDEICSLLNTCWKGIRTECKRIVSESEALKMHPHASTQLPYTLLYVVHEQADAMRARRSIIITFNDTIVFKAKVYEDYE